MFHKTRILHLLMGFGLFLPAMSRAEVIIGNLPQTNDSSGTSFGSAGSKGIGFVMTDTVWFTTATLRLNSGSSAQDPDVYIMSNSGGNPSTILATLQNPTMGLGLANYAFAAQAPLQLLDGVTYWLVLATNSTTSGLVWTASFPAITPTGSLATFAGARFASATFPPTGSSSTINSFQLNGAAATVPEPSTLVTLSGGLGALLLLRSRRKGAKGEPEVRKN